jgi:hypothetical protein
MANFKNKPSTGNPLIDESFNQASNNYQIDDVDYKFYVYLINGNGNYIGLTTESIELLNIRDNVLEIAASGTCVIRNDNDSIERSNIVNQLNTKENYFARQPKNDDITNIDEFFFRNDCRDYLVVYIKPQLTDLTTKEQLDNLDSVSTLIYTFSILENEDITADESNAKFKKLTLIDSDLEILREKNISFSSATLLPPIEGQQLAHLDDDERGATTGVILKNLINRGLNVDAAAETTNNNNSIDNDLFDNGTTTLFYSSPGEYNILNDIDYVIARHTSAAPPFDPCLLRKDRYSGKYTLISYKDYFNKAIFQNKTISTGGKLHFETILQSTETVTPVGNSNKKRTPNTFYNNLTFGEYSMVDSFKFYNMNGIDTQSKLISIAVHSYQLSDKQFQIDLSHNNITSAMSVYYDYFVRGEKDVPLFVSGDKISSNTFMNQIRKNNLNFQNIFSINDTEPDQRLGFGRNQTLKNAIFLNNAIELNVKGLTFRSAGKFFGFDKKGGFIECKFDDKVYGTYFAVQVDHNFAKDSYTNKIIGIKTYLYTDPSNKEIV